LKAALEVTIEALAGNIAGLAAKPKIFDQFLAKLIKTASENLEKFGSAGLLQVFRLLIRDVLATGTLPKGPEIIAALAA
jgi:hypothetical protein